MELFNSLEFLESEGHFPSIEDCDLHEEIDDVLLNRSHPCSTLSSSPLRPMDLPSHRKHYGLLTYFNLQLPILFRLSNNLYVPYIRFSLAMNVLDQHQSNRISPIFDMVKNLPILEMTSMETIYYDRLIEHFGIVADHHREENECSKKLLSVALLDCLLGILDSSSLFFQSEHFHIEQWHEILENMRREVKSRWTIEEQLVLAQVEKQNRSTHDENSSLCISSTNIAARRSFFEKRFDLSLVEQVGGFVQIDSFIFPFIKHSSDGKIYLHLNDIRHRYHQYLLLPSSYIRHFTFDSSIAHAYQVISDQARDNFFWNSIHGSVFMSKCLPNPKDEQSELKFLSLDVLLQAKGSCFVQLFEKASLEHLIGNYQNQFGREFIIGDRTRQAGLIDQYIPCLRLGKINGGSFRTWIPTETKTSRLMTQDERLFLNCFLLYHGRNEMIFSKERRWFFEELDLDVLSSQIFFFDKEYYERKQRKLFVNCLE